MRGLRAASKKKAKAWRLGKKEMREMVRIAIQAMHAACNETDRQFVRSRAGCCAYQEGISQSLQQFVGVLPL